MSWYLKLFQYVAVILYSREFITSIWITEIKLKTKTFLLISDSVFANDYFNFIKNLHFFSLDQNDSMRWFLVDSPKIIHLTN